MTIVGECSWSNVELLALGQYAQIFCNILISASNSHIVCNYHINNQNDLWIKYKNDISEDVLHRVRRQT